MDYLRAVVRRFYNKTKHEDKVSDEQKACRTNAYLNYMYAILLWEDPKKSWTTLGLTHVFFWFIAVLELPAVSVACLTLLLLFVADCYFIYKGLESHETKSSEAIRSIITVISGTLIYLRDLRRENPGTFCGLMCINFLLLSVIAKNINGYLLSYLCLLLIYFGPFVISQLPQKYIQCFKKTIRTISTSEGMLAERELIPFLTEKECNTTEDSLIDEKPESISSSYIVGMSSMPSYQEVEGSLDGLEEDDLELPSQPARKYIPAPEEEYSSESDLEERNIDFDPSHFEGNTSSEDEADLGKGLRFSEEYTKEYVQSLNVPNEVKALSETFISKLVTVGSTILSTALAQRVPVDQALSSEDSDTDFEIINTDDINEGS